jgi:hypothetical protein
MCVTVPVSIPLRCVSSAALCMGLNDCVLTAACLIRHWGLWHHLRKTFGYSFTAFMCCAEHHSRAVSSLSLCVTRRRAESATFKSRLAVTSSSSSARSSSTLSPTSPDGHTIDVKEALKWVLGRGLGAALGVEFRPNAMFEITVTFVAADCEQKTQSLLASAGASHNQRGKGTKQKPAPQSFSASSVVEACGKLSAEAYAT